MGTDSAARPSRPRSWLLVLLGIAVAAFLITRMWTDGAATTTPTPQNQARARTGKDAPIDPAELDVRIEALEGERPGQGDMERNPFRFQPKAAPPAPVTSANKYVAPPPPPPMPQPPSTPPIPLRLMGFITLPDGRRVAALSDCKGATFEGEEGKIVDGQYRVVKLGIESIQIEYVTGKGLQTLRVEGCEPR